VAFGQALDGDLPALFERLTPFMDACAFSSRALIGRERPGVLLRLAAAQAPAAEVLAAIDRAFGLNAAETVRYDDPQRAVCRRIALGGTALRAVRLSGDTRSERWLRDYWERGAAVDDVRRYLVLPVAAPPGVPPARGRVVCNCFDVAEGEIDAALATLSGPRAAVLAALGAKLGCGTNCGSCLPELRQRIALAPQAAVAASF
jgi:assimilatory nitrate reductase catalytic subunit